MRGNHEFEVIRWHNALKSGMKPPAIGGEHYHIACALRGLSRSECDVWGESLRDLSCTNGKGSTELLYYVTLALVLPR